MLAIEIARLGGLECAALLVWTKTSPISPDAQTPTHSTHHPATRAPAVTARHAGNKLLTHRGNALTHDLDLGRATLSALRHATAAHARVELPRYDKSAFSGRGDRFPRAQWRVIEGAVDVVLFEGWMLGFRAVADEDRVVVVDKDLVPINQALQE